MLRKITENLKSLTALNKFLLILCLLMAALISLDFRKILDKHRKKRTRKIEYLVVHYTAHPYESGTAEANAFYLQRKKAGGAHYVIDDKEIIQTAHENEVIPAVGGRVWAGFVPKSWLKGKIFNYNSLNYEVCLGWSRDNEKMMINLAQILAWQLVNKGLEPGAVVRHRDAKGKPCPYFGSLKLNKQEWVEYLARPDKPGYWNQEYEDRTFFLFKKQVTYFWILQKLRLKKIDQKQADFEIKALGNYTFKL